MSQGNLVGQTLGQYQLRELLGVGGMGAVYRAYQVNLKREVAVKIISHNLVADNEMMLRFIREAEVSARLEHNNIVPIYDFGTENGITYVVMRLLTGGSLSRRIEQRIEDARPLISLGEAADLLKHLASALDYAHSHGVIHRDIKPANIMFDNQGKPYVVDFGIAKLTGAGTAFTQTGAAMGTPNYMPPEQWRGETLSPNADQYALGVMVYQLLTGRVPFDGDSAFVLMHKHLNEQPTPLNTLRPDIPPSVMLVIARAMAKEPEQRFQSCTAFAQAFEGTIEGNKGQPTGMFMFKVRPSQTTNAVPVSNRPHTPTGGGVSVPPMSMGVTQPPKSNAQNPLIWALGLMLLAVTVILVVVLVSSGGNDDITALSTSIMDGEASATTASLIIADNPSETVTSEETEQALSTDSPTSTISPSDTPSSSDTPSPTDTATDIPLPTNTLDIRLAAVSTRERIATITAESFTNTPTPDVDATIAIEITRLYFDELTMTATLWTATPTITPTATQTVTNTPSNTPTKTLTRTPSNTPTNTATHTPTATRTATATSTLTQTPRPTSTPNSTKWRQLILVTVTPVNLVARVTVSSASANLRSGPGTNYGVVAAALSGESFDVVARTSDSAWYLIQYNTSTRAWVSASVVTASVPNTSITIAATIPVPPATNVPAVPTSPPSQATTTVDNNNNNNNNPPPPSISISAYTSGTCTEHTYTVNWSSSINVNTIQALSAQDSSLYDSRGVSGTSGSISFGPYFNCTQSSCGLNFRAVGDGGVTSSEAFAEIVCP
ncbi:MAG: serine/threonine protein kinase [bacterium]|nr:serine/threonine protein kinase [bacterium]